MNFYKKKWDLVVIAVSSIGIEFVGEKLKEMKLVKQSRLSVSPVTKDEWEIILKMSNTNL